MGRQLLTIALMLAVLAPPGAGLAGMSTMPAGAMPADGMSPHHTAHDAQNPSKTAASGQHEHAMMAAHDHSAAECDEYCMNCSSHCFSTAIISSSSAFPVPASQTQGFASGDTADRAYLLFRPPIRS